MVKVIKLIIKAIFVVYLVIFAVSNIESVTFKPLMNLVSYDMPLFLLVTIALFIGIVIGSIAMWGDNLSLKSKIRKLKKDIQNSNQEIERLQKLTIIKEDNKEAENKSNNQENIAPQEKPQEVVALENNIKDVLR